ncbi:MAG: phage portal protein [bacterium]|nr:phage portal protein [bacterium]
MFLTASITAGSPGPTDDFWYGNPGTVTASGVRVTEDSAMTTSVVYACVKVLAESVAQLPLPLYERDGDARMRVPDHPLYEILHDRPNGWQTAFEYREMMQGHLALRGNAYAIKDVNRRGEVEQLIPLHPGRVTPERMDSGRIRYAVRDPETTVRAGSTDHYAQDEIHHLRGLSSDGLVGLSPIGQARESVGMALAAQEYGARFFQNDAQPRGIIEHPGAFKDEPALNRFKAGWQEAQSGVNRHKTAILEYGLKYHEVGMSNQDAQFLETRSFQVEDLARMFRMMLHMIGHTEKATTWGTGIEQLTIAFVVYTLGPWLVRWEQAISRDLITRPERYYAEFLTDGLLRGDTTARHEAHGSAIDHGWKTRNEVRRAENLNPLDGLDEPLQPLNMTPAGADTETAARLVEAEITELRAAYTPKSEGKFIAATREIYTEHAKRLQLAFGISDLAADTLCQVSRNELKNSPDIHALLDHWEATRADGLARFVRSVK